MATPAFITPSPDRQRWPARRKAAVVLAVANGDITLDQALKGCNLSAEEFAAWQRDYEVHGVHGLRVTRLQIITSGRGGNGNQNRRPPVKALR